MKRKMVALLTTAAIGLSVFAAPGLTAEAAEGDVTFNGEVIDVSGATELTNSSGTGYLLSDGCTLVVTADIGGAGVNGYPWYDSKDVITKVIIADSVTTMKMAAFTGYANITDVDFNDNMTEISGMSFDGCTGLTELSLPDGLITLGGKSGNGAFDDCTGLTGELVIPASVEVLGGFDNTNISSITFNKGLKKVFEFNGCTNLTTLNFPSTLTEIQGFNDCTGLTGELVIPDLVETIGGFKNCAGITGELDLGNSLEYIESGAFANCTGITSLIIPDTLKQTWVGMFNGCTNLAEITCNATGVNHTTRGAFKNIADTLTVYSNSVEFIEFIQKNYTGVNDTNLKIVELDAEIALGNDTMTVTGSVDTRVVTLDVSIPVGGVQFTIDGDGKLTSQGIVVTSNTTVPLTINVLSAEGQASGVNSEGVVTNIAAPALVPASLYTAEQWDNLGQYGTKQQIAIALKQVDVVDDGLGNLSAGEELTAATTDEAKVTTPVELGNISANEKLAHVLSGVQTAQNIGINVEKDTAFTNYGKEWLDAETNIFRYNVTLEFTY